MDIDTIVKLINGVGFPIFVSVWLLIRFEPMLLANTDATKAMSEIIRKCTGPDKPL